MYLILDWDPGYTRDPYEHSRHDSFMAAVEMCRELERGGSMPMIVFHGNGTKRYPHWEAHYCIHAKFYKRTARFITNKSFK